MTTMRDVALVAGVSVPTVSRVIRGDRYVTEVTQERVRSAIAATGYTPNLAARSLRTGHQGAIGVAVPEIADPFFAAVTQAVEQTARNSGLAVVITSFGDLPQNERPAVEALLSRQVAGLIAVPVAPDQSYLRSWQDRTPMVFIDRSPRGITADSVVEDDFGGSRQAMRHLIKQGHRRIAFLGDPREVPTAGRRLDGYKAALGEAGIPLDPDLVHVGPQVSSRPAVSVQAVLGGSAPATAIFSSNSRCSLGVVPELLRLRRTDVALLSFGDFPMAAALTPAVTVVDQDPAGLGRAAVERLLRRIDEPDRRLRRRVVRPVRLIVRESSRGPEAPASPSGPRVTAASASRQAST